MAAEPAAQRPRLGSVSDSESESVNLCMVLDTSAPVCLLDQSDDQLSVGLAYPTLSIDGRSYVAVWWALDGSSPPTVLRHTKQQLEDVKVTPADAKQAVGGKVMWDVHTTTNLDMLSLFGQLMRYTDEDGVEYNEYLVCLVQKQGVWHALLGSFDFDECYVHLMDMDTFVYKVMNNEERAAVLGYDPVVDMTRATAWDLTTVRSVIHEGSTRMPFWTTKVRKEHEFPYVCQQGDVPHPTATTTGLHWQFVQDGDVYESTGKLRSQAAAAWTHDTARTCAAMKSGLVPVLSRYRLLHWEPEQVDVDMESVLFAVLQVPLMRRPMNRLGCMVLYAAAWCLYHHHTREAQAEAAGASQTALLAVTGPVGGVKRARE